MYEEEVSATARSSSDLGDVSDLNAGDSPGRSFCGGRCTKSDGHHSRSRRKRRGKQRNRRGRNTR